MRERFHELTAETRSFGERMRLLLPPALLLVFTLCVFAPYEYVLTNYHEFWFSFGQIWWCFPLLAICLLAVILLVGVLLRGKLADLYLTLLFALAIAFYIEGNFLPAEYGVQTGAKIQWERYGAYTFFDTGVWCVLCILPFILYWLSARLWRSVLRALSVGILLVQAVTLVTVVAINPDCLHNSAQGIGFSWEGTGELSKNENTLFILVDECDVAYINEQRARPALHRFFGRLHLLSGYRGRVQHYVPGHYAIPDRKNVVYGHNGNRLLRAGMATGRIVHGHENARI